jgi:hypothetical protein
LKFFEELMSLAIKNAEAGMDGGRGDGLCKVFSDAGVALDEQIVVLFDEPAGAPRGLSDASRGWGGRGRACAVKKEVWTETYSAAEP